MPAQSTRGGGVVLLTGDLLPHPHPRLPSVILPRPPLPQQLARRHARPDCTLMATTKGLQQMGEGKAPGGMLAALSEASGPRHP